MTGIELITQALEQKGLRDLPNDDNQYVWAAAHLATGTFARPKDWDKKLWTDLCSLQFEQRVAIAGAFLAMALDKNMEAKQKKSKNIYKQKGDE